MFHLTPQERFALSCLLTILCVGLLISVGLKREARLFKWVKAASVPHASTVLDLNKATVEQLDKLPGIGMKSAQRIVEYRRQNGLYTSLQEVKRIKGISKRSYEALKGRVMIKLKREVRE